MIFQYNLSGIARMAISSATLAIGNGACLFLRLLLFSKSLKSGTLNAGTGNTFERRQISVFQMI